MTLDEINENLTKQSESLNVISTQLGWILTEVNNSKAVPGSSYGNEMAQRFFSLYRDFKRIKKEILDFSNELKSVDAENKIAKDVYYMCSKILLQRCNIGILEQFTAVAEEGILPE